MLAEQETLDKIKYALSHNNEAQALRMLQQYAKYNVDKFVSTSKLKCSVCNKVFETSIDLCEHNKII